MGCTKAPPFDTANTFEPSIQGKIPAVPLCVFRDRLSSCLQCATATIHFAVPFFRYYRRCANRKFPFFRFPICRVAHTTAEIFSKYYEDPHRVQLSGIKFPVCIRGCGATHVTLLPENANATSLFSENGCQTMENSSLPNMSSKPS